VIWTIETFPLLRFPSVSTVNIFRFRFFPAVFLCSIIFTLVACNIRPTPGVNAPPGATTQATQVTNATSAPDSTPTTIPPTAAPVPTRPTVHHTVDSIVIAGVGTPSHEITSLPEFIADGIFDSLLTVNPKDGSLAPGLAEQWLVSDDAKTFEFTLRQGVKWHDGQPLTTADVVFTLKSLSDPAIRIKPAADFGPIADVTAPDARTVRVTFREPYCAALTYIGGVKILPKHRMENKSLTDVVPEDLIGTGALVLQSWDDNALTFSSNTTYWNGAPQIVNWTYKIFPNERAALDALSQGQADLMVGTSAGPSIQDAVAPANEFYALAMNLTRKPFDDVRVRQAVAMGIDRAQLTQSIGADAQTLETSVLPSFWATPNVRQPEYDIAKARQLLSDAGWRDSDGDGILNKDGKPFQVSFWAEADDLHAELAAQILRAQLERIGVRAIIKLDDHILFLTRVFLQEYDLSLAHFKIPLDPDQHYFWASSENKPGYGLNVTGYTNARVDDALAVGNRVSKCNAPARKNVYAPVFQQLASDVPMVLLFAPPRIVNTSPQLQGIAPSSFAGPFWNLNTWELAP